MESEKTQIWVVEDGRQNVVNKSIRERIASKIHAVKSKPNFKNGIKSVALIGAGASGTSTLEYFSNTVLQSEVINNTLASEIEMSSLVNDKMSFSEAFSSARNELGKGGYFIWKGSKFSTFLKEEWDVMTENQKSKFLENVEEDYKENLELLADEIPSVVIYDEAPCFVLTEEHLSFNDAFAMARQEVGPGGYFKWNGNKYSTYYKEEWEQMDMEEQKDFFNSIHDDDTTSTNDSLVEYGEFEIIDNPNHEVFIEEHTHSIYGNNYNVGYFQSNEGVVIKVDANMDGIFDYVVEEDALIGLNGNDSYFMSDNPNIDFVQSTIIEGHSSLVTFYENGDMKIEVDVEDNGYADATIYLDGNGEVSFIDHTNTTVYKENSLVDDTYVEMSDDEYVDVFGDDFQNNTDMDDWSNDASDLI